MTLLLEREHELGEIDALLEEVGAGKGRAVAIEAGAGLGKTRLLQEVRRMGTSRGLSVFSARATELERDFTFALVRQLFEVRLAALAAGERERVLEGASSARSSLGLEREDGESPDSFAVLHGPLLGYRGAGRRQTAADRDRRRALGRRLLARLPPLPPAETAGVAGPAGDRGTA